jgi:ABC-type nitrate/sulfonate/bicarbonate transport system substrate-binding protein
MMAMAMLGTAALVLPVSSAAQGAPEQQNVQLWTTRDAQQGALPIVAARQGFFRDNGLNVELRFVSSGAEIPAGMAGGTIPIAVAAWTNPDGDGGQWPERKITGADHRYLRHPATCCAARSEYPHRP